MNTSEEPTDINIAACSHEILKSELDTLENKHYPNHRIPQENMQSLDKSGCQIKCPLMLYLLLNMGIPMKDIVELVLKVPITNATYEDNFNDGIITYLVEPMHIDTSGCRNLDCCG